MPYNDLREFIHDLEAAGELKRITAPVDRDLEVTEITDRVSKQLGPALLFENVKGSKIPLLINALGTPRRMCMALGVERIDDLSERLALLLDPDSPTTLMDKIKMLPMLKEIGDFFPKSVGTGPCKDVVQTGDAASLADLPIITCWPDDGGRYITLPLVFTHNPATGKRNCGIYRMQVYDDRTTGMHWHIHKDGAHHHQEAERRGERIEVGVALGCAPEVTFSAVVPLPEDIDEMLFAGFLRGKPVRMVGCETVDVQVPATAEIVLEGYVEPGERRREGPFGDHTGFYSLADDYPVFHLTGVTHRTDPIYQTTIVGPPPMEDCHIGYAIERIFLPLMRKQLPEIVDMHMPFEGVFHNLMLVAIRKSYPGQARKIMHAIWGLGQAMFTKMIVVVDEHVDVHDPGDVVWRVLNNMDPKRDIEFAEGPVDVLNHASPLLNYGSKMGIDGTRKWKSEGFNREWPEELLMSKPVQDLVDQRWKEYGL